MGKTISCSSGSVAVNHDRRYFKSEKDVPENINPELSPNNIYLTTCDNAKKAFNDFFRESVEEYNSRQSRSDRKKTDYYDEIQNSKNGETAVYEYVFQIGNKDDTSCLSKDGEICRDILVRFAKSFERDNPNFHVISSCVHMDEATPHLHIAFIPWAENYKKGLKKRCSTSKALENMGYKGEERNMRSWKHVQEDRIETLMTEYDMKRVRLDTKRERLEVSAYKELKEMAVEDAKHTFEKRFNKKIREMDELETQFRALEYDYECIKDDFNVYLRERKSLRDEIKELEGYKTALKTENANLGRLKGGIVAELQKIIEHLKKIVSSDVVMGERALKFIEKRGLKAEFLKFLYEPVTKAEQGVKNAMSMNEWKKSIDRSSRSVGSAEPDLAKEMVNQKNKDERS